MIIFVYVTPAGEAPPSAQEWIPWNSTDDESTAILAARKFLRERFGEFITKTEIVDVYTYPEDAPRWPNGAPKQCKKRTLIFGKKILPPSPRKITSR